MPEKLYYGVCTRKGIRFDGYEGKCPTAFWMTKPYFAPPPTKCCVCGAKIVTRSRMQPTLEEWLADKPSCFTPLEFIPNLCNRAGSPDEGFNCGDCMRKHGLTDAL